MDNDEIVPPHLNAEVYRKDLSSGPNLTPYLDYIVIHKDGYTLIGCSELTGRYWNGGAKILKSANDVENVQNYCKEFISLPSGTADGCFVNNSGKVLLCEDKGTVSIWSRAESCWGHWEEIVSVSEHDDSAVAVACLDPEKEYVSVGFDGNIKIWDVKDMVCMTSYNDAHSMGITGIAVQDGSQKFVTTSYDKYISLWDKNSKDKLLDIAALECGVRCVQWLNEHEIVVGDEAGELNLFDLRNTRNIARLTTFPAPIHKINAQPISRRIAVCCDNKIVTVSEVSATNTLDTLYTDSSKHNNYVRGMAWDSTEKNTLHTVAWDGSLICHSF